MGQYSKYLSFDHIKKKSQSSIKMPPISKEEDVIIQEEVAEETKPEEAEATEEASGDNRRGSQRIMYLKTENNKSKPPKYSMLQSSLQQKPDTQENNTMAEFILKNLFSILYKHVQI